MKKKRFYIIIFILFISSVFYSNDLLKEGLNPSFEYINRENGISNLSVSSMIQDKYGFIWFGTQGGLNRYDGRNMKIYTNDPFEDDVLIHNLIQTMYYDEDKHDLWIGTYQGISRLKIYENSFINYTVEKNNLSNSVIVAITKDENDIFWAGTLSGLNKINPDTGEVKIYEIPGNVVRSLLLDSENRLWIGTYEGLFYYDKLDDKIKKYNIDLPSSFVMAIKEYEPNILTLGLWGGGITNIDLKTNEMKTITFSDNRVYSIIRTNDGIKWIGTWGGGLFAITPDGKNYHFAGDSSDSSLVHPVVYSMLQDHSDILWVGTNGGGVCKINPRKNNYTILSYDPEQPEGLSAGKINDIFRDSEGNLWIAVYNEGLDKYNPITNSITKYRNNPIDPYSLSTNSIVTIFETSDKKLIFGGGYSGIIVYDYDLDNFYNWDILPYEDLIIYSFAESDNKDLWIGTYTHGTFRYNPTTKELKQYHYINKDNFTLSDNLVFSVLADSKGRIWVGTNNGLNLLKPNEEEFKIYKRIPGDRTQLASNTARLLFEDSKGRIWISLTGGGLAIYNETNDSFKSITEREGLASNVISGILEASDGRIWVSTHNGISIINPENDEIYNLTPEDGIGGWEFNTGHLRDYNNNLMFAGIHGIISIPESFSDKTLSPPNVYITEIDIFQNPIDSNKLFFNNETLKFSHKDNFIGFKSVALDFDSPEKITFSYKLEGFDYDWINAGTRDYIYYSNLSPGNYTFNVIAHTARGVKSHPVKFYFSISSPWYKTNIAFAFYIIGLLIIFIAFFKLREGRLLNKKNKELANINQKLEETIKSRNIFMSKISHDLKSPLNGIYGLTEVLRLSNLNEDQANNCDLIIHSVDIILKLIEDLRDISSIESGSLELQKDNFNIFSEINGIVKTFNFINENNNEITLNLEDKIPKSIFGDKYRLNRIIQNILSNSVKFTKNGKIELTVSLDDETSKYHKINFKISDTGKGIDKEKMKKLFTPYYQAHVFDGTGSGLGLSLCKELVELMNGKIYIESEIGKGTTVTFFVIFEKI